MLELGSWKDNRSYQECLAEGIEEGLRRARLKVKWRPKLRPLNPYSAWLKFRSYC